MSIPSKYVVRKGPVYYAVLREVERRNAERLAALASAEIEQRRLDEERRAAEIEAEERKADEDRAERRRALDASWGRSRGNPTVAQIQRAVCRFYDVSFRELISHRKTADVVRPRQIAMMLAKELTIHSFPEIGRRFDRDHTTVLYAVRKIESLCEENDAVAADVAAIRGKIKSIFDVPNQR